MIEENNPLVSIIIITYNSSKYVVETLESAKAQTYQNIELIVTDDCSTDNTIEICREWLDCNKGRFIRTELVTVEKNTGIAPNCNRGLFSSKGEWIKFIAGDDILLPECINVYIDYMCNYGGLVFFAKFKSFPYDEYYDEIIKNSFNKLKNVIAKKQFRILLTGNIIPAPTSFLNHELLLKIGGFDERFPFYEDYPLWIKILKNNIQLVFIDELTVKYRIHEQSISQSNSTQLSKTLLLNSSKNYELKVLLWLQIKSLKIKFVIRKLLSVLKNKHY